MRLFHWHQMIHKRPLLKTKPNFTKRFQWLIERLIKRTLHHERKIPGVKVTTLSNKKSCQMIFSNIVPNMLSKWVVEEPMLHMMRTILRATLVNRGRDPPSPFIHYRHLMENQPKRRQFLYAPCVCAKSNSTLGKTRTYLSYKTS